MSYDFIEPSKERPEFKGVYKNCLKKITKEFQSSNVKYARGSFDRIEDSHKSAIFCDRLWAECLDQSE